MIVTLNHSKSLREIKPRPNDRLIASSRKLTQPSLLMNNIFPPINGHSRPTSEDLRGTITTTQIDMNSASKSQQIRRQQPVTEQTRRTPLRSSSLLPSAGTRYVTAAAAAAAAVPPPTTSGSPLLRSPSFVQTGSSTQFEPAKIVYRSNDFAWNDHPTNSNQNLRAPSPLKNKVSTSARQLSNGNLPETNGANGTNVTGQFGSSVSPNGFPSNLRDDMNNVDLLMNTTVKSRPSIRVQRTSSHIDRMTGTAGHAIPMRSESYRSNRHDYGIRARHTSPKQRNYVSSKTSFYDLNTGEFYLNGNQDENLYYQQHQARVNGSNFDLSATRKPLTAYKSNTFHVPANAINSHLYQNSSHDFYRSETNLDRNLQTRGGGRGTATKEFVNSPSKTRNPSGLLGSNSNTPADRQSSPHSYKSRDPNDSYAYNNVKKYIEENDLMSPEKEQLIRNWVFDVEKYRHQLQKLD